MSDFSKYVHAMGRGPSKGRNLSQNEAQDAMNQILGGTVDPHAVGALLMLMRYRGETPAEIAGFIEALRTPPTHWPDLDVAVDWPSYAAGRTRGVPWFLLAAKLVARAGHPVFLHGWNSHQNPIASVRKCTESIGIVSCANADHAADVLDRNQIVYCPLEVLNAPALSVLRLRSVLGLRSAMNTALRGYNPTGAHLTVQGVFHPSYRDLQTDAARLLEQPTIAVIKGGGGEFEVNPSKDIDVFFQTKQDQQRYVAQARIAEPFRLNTVSNNPSDLIALWDGHIENEAAKNVVISTAAIALHGCTHATNSYENAYAQAEELWDARNE